MTKAWRSVARALALAMLWCAARAAASDALPVAALDAEAGTPSIEQVIDGSLDERFHTLDSGAIRARVGAFWLRLEAPASESRDSATTINVSKRRDVHVRLYTRTEEGFARALPLATALPMFAGSQEAIFVLPETQPDGRIYVQVRPSDAGAGELHFRASRLDASLALGAERARMIALTFGALIAMSFSAFLIWFVLSDRLLLLYGSLFVLQALYVAYLSGQGFEWPLLSVALPFMQHAWNVPAALSGAAACLFVREIAELQRFSPRVYRWFGWLAGAFVVLAFANVARRFGLGDLVAMIGNLIFLASAIFTLVVSFLAWRRNNRAAGWFLLAWGLLESFTIATAVHLLMTKQDSMTLLYYGLPLSMAAAAVLIALGVADRLRDERRALTDAQRRAQTDSLTGVLNRRSLIERLDAACLRAQARGLPIALLFIDLDHFKEINDTYGHAAGDACLKAIIEPIHAELRQSDVIGRYGGEEFVVILSSADVAAAEPIAERIRNRVADVRVEGFGPPIHVTCSIGVATSDMLGVWGEKLIARADEAVYVAKRAGRNRVQIAAPLAA